MKRYHILYTDKNNKFKQCYKRFKNFAFVEKWLKSIGAIYWEIGIKDTEIKELIIK